MNIREYLQNNCIVTDGAMGTYFDSLYPGGFTNAEEANITAPDYVRRVHEDYIDAGANLIRTNTFTVNQKTLALLQHNDPETFKNVSLADFVKAGCDIAKASAAGKNVLIAGDIGPIKTAPDETEEEILAGYRELCDAFAAQDLQIYLFETFPADKYVIYCARYLKSIQPDAYIIAQFAFGPSGYSAKGLHYQNVLKVAAECPALDAVGFNCGIGAAHMKHFYRDYIRKVGFDERLEYTALPNCGYPQVVRGRVIYSDSVDYFTDKLIKIHKLGVNIIGGCCGTTPEYIRSIRQAVDQKEELSHMAPVRLEKKPVEDRARKIVPNRFRDKILSGQTAFAVELDPPFDINVDKLFDGASKLKDSCVDLITVADSPLGRPRVDSMMIAAKLKADVGVDAMPHICCRDRNRISMRSGLLGAHVSDIRNVLAVTGDPVGAADRGFVKSVFDFNSFKLMDYIRKMNVQDFAGDELFVGGALNQNSANIDKIAERMKKKIDNGCSFFLTQPVYDEEGVDRLIHLRDVTEAKILIGIMPLVSKKNALFIANEMPGIHVPQEVVDLYLAADGREEWEDIASDVSLSIMKMAGKELAGIYMMTPFNRVSLIKRILDEYTQGL